MIEVILTFNVVLVVQALPAHQAVMSLGALGSEAEEMVERTGVFQHIATIQALAMCTSPDHTKACSCSIHLDRTCQVTLQQIAEQFPPCLLFDSHRCTARGLYQIYRCVNIPESIRQSKCFGTED